LTDILNVSALEYVQMVRTGSFTVSEFLSETLDQIQDLEPRLHAYLSVADEAALTSQAKGIDRRLRSGERVGACAGMPISLKDNLCVAGGKTTCGSRMLEGYVAPYDATVVSRLRAEDAVLVGKTNMDEFAMGLTTEFSAFGPSRNPWNTEYVPGGSSGGSAVATAARECVASLGSDTGGSVRNPASFCSVVGYKPTYGLVSRYGLISYANSIEQIGPLTRTVGDAAFLLNIVAGSDANDDTTLDGGTGGGEMATDYLEGIDDGIDGMRVGVIREMMDDNAVDPQVAEATCRAVSDLEQMGAVCNEISVNMVMYSVAAYYTITAAEAESNLARYDNLRYGYDHVMDGYGFSSYIEEARRMFGPEVARRIIVGGFVSSAGHAGQYYMKALKVRGRITQQIGEAFQTCDLLVAPTVPILPFRMGEKSDNPVELFMVDLNTVTANLTGRPSISVPYAVSREGLPIGVQIMADIMQDRLLLRAARALESKAALGEVPLG